MRAAVHHAFGNPAEELKAEEVEAPKPGPGEVLIKTTLSAIHNHDLITVEGNYGYKPALPAIGGSEAVGVIEQLGEGVSGVSVGQRVAVVGVHGTWAEYFVAKAKAVAPLPDAISDEAGAQLLGMPLSAYFLLDFVGVQSGDWVIQNAANGAVAKVLAMIARTRGINVINLVRRSSAIAELEELGITNVLATDDDGWQDAVKTMTGDSRIKAAVDGVAGPDAAVLMSLLGENGVFVSFGAMSGKPLSLSASDLIFKQALVKGFWLGKMMETMPQEEKFKGVSTMMKLVASGDVKLQVGGIFDLDDMSKAAAASRESGRPGKVLVRP
ncbi:zinc-binding dehydrogenase [Agrobacterium sp. ES01]|uniref:zinc-binding dehydrogenase n=1 Tax=Agrobacterium sp. ES01 TaxID=3420714 RepID=UPI003D1296E5